MEEDSKLMINSSQHLDFNLQHSEQKTQLSHGCIYDLQKL